MDKLSTFFTLMAAMSIAAERVVEIIKGIFPSLAAVNRSLDDFLNSSGDAWGMGLMALKYFIIGVMVSGGSALWNHALDIVGAVKTVQEKKAAQ